MVKKKNPQIIPESKILESHLELITTTELTENYTLNIISLVKITRKFVDIPRTLKEEIEEEEIYRIGFQDTAKTMEAHKQIVDTIEHLQKHHLLSLKKE